MTDSKLDIVDRLRLLETEGYKFAGEAADEIKSLRKALRTAMWAMRAPLDGWKGDVERLALDAAHAVLDKGSNEHDE